MMLFGISHFELEFLTPRRKMGPVRHLHSVQFDNYAFPKYAAVNDNEVLFGLTYLELGFCHFFRPPMSTIECDTTYESNDFGT
jgi:hypothetical protein